MYLNKPKVIITNTHFKRLMNQGYVIEPKLDGSRHIIKSENQSITILRESGRIKNSQFPEILNNIILPDNTIIDGEVCYLKSDLVSDFYSVLPRENLMNQTKINLLSKEFPLTFVAFDIIKYQDKDLRELSYTTRREYLNKIQTNNNLKVITNYNLEQFTKFDRTNMEGIVIKNPNGSYNSDQFKYKFYVETDFNVIGYTSETRLISALELADQDNNYVGKVNYINYPQTKDFAEKLKGMVAVVRHQWTNNNKVKFPVLKELRSKC